MGLEGVGALKDFGSRAVEPPAIKMPEA